MCGRHSLTAFVYDKRGRLLSIGRNSYVKTHPLMLQAGRKVGNENRQFLHAEVDALVKLKDWSRAYKMVITRYKRDGTPGCAAPCSICRFVINQTGIKEVVHT